MTRVMPCLSRGPITPGEDPSKSECQDYNSRHMHHLYPWDGWLITFTLGGVIFLGSFSAYFSYEKVPPFSLHPSAWILAFSSPYQQRICCQPLVADQGYDEHKNAAAFRERDVRTIHPMVVQLPSFRPPPSLPALKRLSE